MSYISVQVWTNRSTFCIAGIFSCPLTYVCLVLSTGFIVFIDLFNYLTNPHWWTCMQFLHFGIVIVSLGCYNQVITLWLQTRKKDFIIVLEVRSPQPRCKEGCVLSEGSRKRSFLASFYLLVAAPILGVPWLIDIPPQSLSPSSHGLLLVCLLCISSFLRKTPISFDECPLYCSVTSS